MISALLYLQFHSVKNRLITRFKRLRQPKYLFGAIVGGAYFYWYAFANVARIRRQHGNVPGIGMTEDLSVLIQLLGALVFLVIVAGAWLFPHQRAAMAFTEAEISFLFPAPVSRRMLINFKLLKSQLAILFSSLIFALVASRSMQGDGTFLIHVLGWWVVFATLNLHFIGSSFARTLLLDRGVSNWQRRIAVITVLIFCVGAVFVWARRTLPPPTEDDLSNFNHIVRYLRGAFESGPALYLLFPFRLVLGPYFSKTWLDFFVALGPALLLMALHYWWIIGCDVAFEEASLDYSRKIAERVAAMRTNNWQQISKPKKAKRSPFKLAPAGNPFMALLWKNLIGSGQTLGLRFWLMMIWLTVFPSIVLAQAAKTSGIGIVIGGLAVGFLFFSMLLGPHLLRCDLRQDLLVADVLKMYPMRGWQIVLGEILAPTVILTCVQCLLISIAGVFLSDIGRTHISLVQRGSFMIAAMVLSPAINGVLLLIPNAAVLLFPAWFHSKEPLQGIEMMGQRLILFIGQFLFLILSLLPAALVFAGIFALIYYFIGLALAVPVAAIFASAILVIEAGFAVRAMGKVFERLDLSQELAG